MVYMSACMDMLYMGGTCGGSKFIVFLFVTRLAHWHTDCFNTHIELAFVKITQLHIYLTDKHTGDFLFLLVKVRFA